MNDIVNFNINYEEDAPMISGRELYDVLEIKTPYTMWFDRMVEYGFSEGVDYLTILLNRADGRAGKPKTDHNLSISMAKEICMIQRSDIGKKCRLYFLELEKKWNSPDAIMARALAMSQQALDTIREENAQLMLALEAATNTIDDQKELIEEMTPKSEYHDRVWNNPGDMTTTQIAKDYGWSAQQMNKYLQEKKVQFPKGHVWNVYQKYAALGLTHTMTEPVTDGAEIRSISRTRWTPRGRIFIYEMLKSDGILPLCEQSTQLTIYDRK